jgi:hypothetical protein
MNLRGMGRKERERERERETDCINCAFASTCRAVSIDNSVL